VSHPKEDLLRGLYLALGRGDLATFLAGCTDGVVFTVPGRAAVSGTFTKATFLDMARPMARADPGTFHEEILDVIANDDHGIVLLSHRLRRDGRRYEYRTAHVVRFSGGLIAAWWEHPGSPAELEAAWGPLD
jgi:ketosteroid isomerase-like protein